MFFIVLVVIAVLLYVQNTQAEAARQFNSEVATRRDALSFGGASFNEFPCDLVEIGRERYSGGSTVFVLERTVSCETWHVPYWAIQEVTSPHPERVELHLDHGHRVVYAVRHAAELARLIRRTKAEYQADRSGEILAKSLVKIGPDLGAKLDKAVQRSKDWSIELLNEWAMKWMQSHLKRYRAEPCRPEELTPCMVTGGITYWLTPEVILPPGSGARFSLVRDRASWVLVRWDDFEVLTDEGVSPLVWYHGVKVKPDGAWRIYPMGDD